MIFRIPKSEREHVDALISADPAVIDAYARVADACAPELSQFQFAAALSARLGEVNGASESMIASITRTLFAVYAVLLSDSKVSVSDAAAQVIAEVQKDPKFYGTPTDGWDAFKNRLTRLLSIKTLGVAAKAANVAYQSFRHTHGLRILTDARPVFGGDVNEGPIAFTILHTLQIDYFEDGQNREWYVSLDAEDIESLRTASDRAAEKEAVLRTTLARLGLPILSLGTSSNE